MNLVVVGHVDHGKSTVVGRLLADTGSLPDGKMEQIRAKCEQHGKQFEYAFLLDALSEEQAQGITIDVARIFFETLKRHYIIIDAPGHIEFLKNMVTGASHAEAALLVIDAHEGIQENSRRHGFMLSLLGVRSVIVLVNKIDLVGFSKQTFHDIRSEYEQFLQEVGIEPLLFIPVSGLHGDNIAARSARTPWYSGPHVLESLDSLKNTQEEEEHELRMYVQDVYKFTKYGDDRRLVVGTLDSGTLRAGDTVRFFPSGKKSQVSSLEWFNGSGRTAAGAGEAVAFTLSEQIYIMRGELAANDDERRPEVTTRLNVSLFWLGKDAMARNAEYTLKIGTTRVKARVEQITKVVDAASLEIRSDALRIERNEVAECVLKLSKAVAFDEIENHRKTSRFVIVDNFRIAGGGIIREALQDAQSRLREHALVRDGKWIGSAISMMERAEKYNQKPLLLLITGNRSPKRQTLARALEAKLFQEGKIVYFMGIGSIIHGLDADIDGKEGIGQEHIRRLGEVANLILNAGLLFVVTAARISEEEQNMMAALVGEENMRSIWVGSDEPTMSCNLHLPDTKDTEEAVSEMKQVLYEANAIFRPW